MNEDFIITDLKRVVLIGKNEYSEKVINFGDGTISNELIFYLSGKATVKFNGKTLNCEENVIRFLPKGDYFEYTVDREERGECIDICFDTNIPISEEAFTIKLKQVASVERLFKKIFSVWVAKGDGYYFECIGLLYKIFSELQKRNYIPESQYNAVKPAINYINENFLSEKISMPQLADLCRISESYLKKIFIKKFGVSPLKYVIGLKINHACDLLRSELYTVGQVAEICGYSNPHFFSRQFKDYMGISPKEFIEKYKSSK